MTPANKARSGTYMRPVSEPPPAASSSETDFRAVIVARLLERVPRLPTVDLLHLYEESLRPSEMPPAMPNDEQDVITAISTSPGSAIALTYRAVELARDRVINLREIVQIVHRSNRTIKRNTVQTSLTRLARAGRIEHVGPPRSGDYKWLK